MLSDSGVSQAGDVSEATEVRSSTESDFVRRFGELEAQKDLKRKTIRGGAITISSQLGQFVVYTLSAVVLARLLSPMDYGLVGMVTAVTGFLRVLKDAGLSTATVQKERITHEQVSTIFWLNMSLGLTMTLFSMALASALVFFYREPRLYWIAVAMGATFTIDAAGAQHQALMRREMRFRSLALVDLTSMSVGLVVSITAALAGLSYWALVVGPIVGGFVGLLGVWVVEPWRPGLPRRRTGAGSMLRFGGYLTLVNLLNYLFRNADNVLIGWRWGAVPLGFYQKAYSLLMLPIAQINSPISAVAVSTLSRITEDSERHRRYFVGGYTIATSVTVPIVVAVTIFAGDIIPFVLGNKWVGSVAMFRLLAPAALVGALLNPFGWLFISGGQGERQFKCAVVWAALILLAFMVGLKYGPEGVAVGYSVMSTLLALPLCFYATKGTAVTVMDLARALKLPALAAAVAGMVGLALKANLPAGVSVGLVAVGGCALVLGTYALLLLKVMGQWQSYVELAKYCLPASWFAGRGRSAENV